MNFKNLLGLVCGFGLVAGTSAFAQLPKASEIYPKMGIGYNIGNTMEVPNDPTAWGNIVPNEAIIKGIKAAGFSNVRIPCAWNSHASNGVIDAAWLNTVKELVDLCIKEGLYVMLNSHWDNGWMEDNVFSGSHLDRDGKPSTTDSSAVRKLQESYWEQIATVFKDYDEHLLFASANEPGVNDARGSGADFPEDGQMAFKADRMTILTRLHEACLRAVRKTGGNNATRTVIVQMPRTEYKKATLLVEQYPVDPAGAGYTMAEFHWYPYQLAFMPKDESWGNVFYYWEDHTTGTDDAHTCKGSDPGSKASTEETFSALQTLFVDQGIPVVIGEMGVTRHYSLASNPANLEKHLEARAAWYGYTVATAKTHGLIPVVWDTGHEGTNDDVSNFTIIRRQEKYGANLGAVVDEAVMKSMNEQFAAAPAYAGAPDAPVIADGDSAIWLTYKSKTNKKSETGTLRFNIAGGADWSAYKAISLQIRTEGEATGCEGDTANGCNGFAWTAVSMYVMGSDWADYNMGDISKLGTVLHTVTIPLEGPGSNAAALNLDTPTKVTAWGINLYGTQFNGNLYLNNVLLIKEDGSADTLLSCDRKVTGLSASGTASMQIIPANAKGEGPKVTDAIKTTPVVSSSKMFVNVQQGYVNATFTAKEVSEGKAMLMNTMGQVIASERFMTRAGNNTVQLKTNFRGPALLMVQQGSQKFSRRVILK